MKYIPYVESLESILEVLYMKFIPVYIKMGLSSPEISVIAQWMALLVQFLN